MKLIFKKIRLKNFRSVSNHQLELDLNQQNTLITSVDNGSGKSTVTVTGICFALYGKPYGKGKKGALVNSRNGRECLVELDFETKGHEYTIRRGIKPDLFEIYEDGKLIDQDAAKKDYQEVLNDILGVDEKILFNSVLIGRDKFVPFAEMNAGERRHYIEKMLDLEVFSVMTEINKSDIKQLNLKISDIDSEKYKSEVELKSKISLIEALSETKKTYKDKISDKILSIEKDSVNLNSEIDSLKSSIDKNEYQDYSEWMFKTNSAISDLKSNINQIDSNVRKANNDLSNVDTSDKCKLCGNSISIDHLLVHKKDLTEQKEKLELEKNKLSNILYQLQKKYEENKKLQYAKDEASASNTKIEAKIEKLEFCISENNKNIQKLQVDLEEPQDFDAKIKSEKSNCKNIIKSLEDIKSKAEELLQEKSKLDIVSEMLKDDGIKSSIVNEYMPFLNKKVNEYLEKLNFILKINIDKEFNIEIVSPDRKGQSLMDLSSGQLRRIDLSNMLAWRDIGIATSALSTNLLILDETLENLSSQGVADFIEMFKVNFQNISLFVISQRKNEFEEFFENQIHLILDSEGFTKIYE